jgi:hypothetical protein
MKHYSQTAVERTMKVQEVIMRAMANQIAGTGSMRVAITT